MKESKFEKIKFIARSLIKKLTGHKYGCCDKLYRNCKKCKWG